MTIDERERRKEAKAIRSLNRRDEHEELADDALKALIQVIILLVGIIIGFQIGVQKAHAAVLTKGHLSATWMPGAEIVEPVPEIPPEDSQPPEALEVDGHAADIHVGPSTPSDPVPEEVWESLGRYKITFYCACRQCSGKWGHRTSSGATCQEGVTAACAILPEWAQVRIDGFGDRVIQDTGAGVRGRHIDIFYEDHQLCSDLGIQYKEVWIRRK